MKKAALSAIVGMVLILAGASSARAASVGDVVILTDNTNSSDIAQGTSITHSYANAVRTDTGVFTPGGTDLALDHGHYLVIYNDFFASTGGSNRSEFNTHLNLNGTDLPIGWGQGYIRRTSGQDEQVVSGAGIINVAADGHVLQVQTDRTDNNGAGARRENATTTRGALQLVKLDDSADYLRLSRSSTQGGPSGDGLGNAVEVQYNQIDESSAGFGFTSGSSDITLNKASKYLVVANTDLNSGGRSTFNQFLTLNGAEVPGTRTSVYIRNNESTNDGAAAIATIIEAGAGDILNVNLFRDNGSNTPTIQANSTALTIVRIGDGADYIRLSETAGTQNIEGPGPVTWDTAHEVAGASFGFTPGTSEITVNANDDYLFFHALWGNSTTSDRQNPNAYFEIDGTESPLGQSGFFNRDDGDGGESGGNFGGLITGLTSGQTVELNTRPLAATGGQYPLDYGSLTGVPLSQLFLAIPELTWDGTTGNAWMSNHWDPGPTTPAGGEKHIVGAGQALVQSDPPQALKLTLTGGEVEVQSGYTLDVATDVDVTGGVLDVDGQLDAAGVTIGAGGTFELAGTLNAGSLATSGTNVIAGTAVLNITDTFTLDSAFNAAGATLNVNTATVNLNGSGSLTYGSGLTADTVNLNGGAIDLDGNALTVGTALNVLANTTVMPARAPINTVPTLNLDSGTLDYAANLAANTVNANGGGLNLSDNTLTVNSALNVNQNFNASNTTLAAAAADVALNNGTLTYDRALTVANLTDAGGALQMNGNQLDVTDTLQVNNNETFGTTGKVVTNHLALNGTSTLNVRDEVEIAGGGGSGGTSASIDVDGAGATLNFTGGGHLDADTLRFSNTGGNRLLGGSLVPTGSNVNTIVAAGGAELTTDTPVAGGDFLVAGGTVHAGHALGTADVQGGLLNLNAGSSAAALDVSGGTASVNAPVTVGTADVSGTGQVNLAAALTVTGAMYVRNTSVNAGTHGVTMDTGSQLHLSGPHTTLEATSGQFKALGTIDRNVPETIHLMSGATVTATALTGPVTTFTGASVGNDTNSNFPAGGTLVQDPGTGTYTITGSGNDIWGNSDGFYYAYKTFDDPGEPFDLMVRHNGFTGGTNGWRKGGIMIRQSLAADSRNAMVVLAANDNFRGQTRPQDGAGSGSSGPGSRPTPRYARIRYLGDGRTFEYWNSTDGVSWSDKQTRTFNAGHELTGPFYLGLGVTAHDTSEQTTVTFDELSGDWLRDPGAVPLNNLSGNGTIVGDIAIAGELSPGDSIGQIDVLGDLTMESGSAYRMEIGAGVADCVTVSGELTFEGDWVVELYDLGGLPALPDEVCLFQGFSELTGGDLGNWTIDGSGVPHWDTSSAQIIARGDGVYLTGEIIPEPATMLALVGGLAAMGGYVRRRRRLR